MKAKKTIINLGDIIKVCCINFYCGWEFDSPTFLISPFYDYSESYTTEGGLLLETIEKIETTKVKNGKIIIEGLSEKEILGHSEWAGVKLSTLIKHCKNYENGKYVPDKYNIILKEFEIIKDPEEFNLFICEERLAEK